MSWECYAVKFRLRSTLHSGLRKVGNLQTARAYVPGWAMWGAFTARICRDAGRSDYEAVGNSVRENMAFTHFLPDLAPMGSYTSTALANGYVKEDGSLHETEYLAPYGDAGRAIQLEGKVFVRKGKEVQGWKEAATRLALGGERAYGWGRVELVTTTMEAPAKWDLVGERPVRKFDEGERLMGHVERADGVTVDGETEVVVRRLTAGGKFGSHVSPARFCWTPSATARAAFRAELDGDGFFVRVEGAAG